LAQATYGTNGENTNSNRKSLGYTAGFMRKSGIIAILVLSAISIAGAQSSGSANSSTGSNHATARRVIQIVSPAFGENLEGTSVSIRYEVSSTKRTSAHPATFRLKMDAQPPVETIETAYTFDSLAPGPHDVTVELLDSRNRPVASSLAETSFVSTLPETSASAELVVEPMLPPTLQKVAMFLPQAAAPIDPGDGSAEMPLLTVIGLGVLVGGMVSAMKTRT
jgi:hypothetical protein